MRRRSPSQTREAPAAQTNSSDLGHHWVTSGSSIGHPLVTHGSPAWGNHGSPILSFAYHHRHHHHQYCHKKIASHGGGAPMTYLQQQQQPQHCVVRQQEELRVVNLAKPRNAKLNHTCSFCWLCAANTQNAPEETKD